MVVGATGDDTSSRRLSDGEARRSAAAGFTQKRRTTDCVHVSERGGWGKTTSSSRSDATPVTLRARVLRDERRRPDLASTLGEVGQRLRQRITSVSGT